MYCEKCGTEIPKGAKFCEKCGASVEPELQGHTEGVSHKKWIVGGIIGGVVVVITLFAAGVFGSKEEAVQTSIGGGIQSNTGVSEPAVQTTEQSTVTPAITPTPVPELSKEIEADISAKAAVLIDNNSGQIMYEKAKDIELAPASLTKIMTMLLIYDAIEQGKISVEDEVTVSEYAAGMGGNEVYFEAGEIQTVSTMIKCIAIASANDASVAMAEKIADSEENFVKMMNERAKNLGMSHTQFKDCTGQHDNIESGNISSAYDIALMSREMVMKYPQISNYTTIWMDSITHKSEKRQEEFGITNTNKLVRFYEGITGLIAGASSKAKYCLSATAKREEVNLTAVVMASSDHKTRFIETQELLDAGFANTIVK